MQEVIELLENIIRITNTVPYTISDEIINKQANAVIDKLREAPEQPREAEVRHPTDLGGKPNHKHSYCYSCGTGVKNQKYCGGCGKKLKWPACPDCKAPEPTELKLPVFLPDDYDSLYSVAQALVKRFIELYAENKSLNYQLETTKSHYKRSKEYAARYINMLMECFDFSEREKANLSGLGGAETVRKKIKQLQAKRDKCDDCVYLIADSELINEHIEKEQVLEKTISELQAQIDKLVEGQQAKTIAGSGGKASDEYLSRRI